MGDRSVVGFKDDKNDVIFLYGHWLGSDNVEWALYKALKAAEPRWGDTSYATRIAISSIVGLSWTSETGFGLFVNELPYSEHPIVIVNWGSKLVEIYDEQVESSTPDLFKKNIVDGASRLVSWSFTEYFNKMSDHPDNAVVSLVEAIN